MTSPEVQQKALDAFEISRLENASALLGSLRIELLHFRLKRMLTQDDVARDVECHRNTIASFERGERECSLSLAARIMQWMAEVLRMEMGVDGR